MVAISALLVLAAVSTVQAARASQPNAPEPQPSTPQAQIGSGFQGQFATGGPHSNIAKGVVVNVAPKAQNLPHLVTVGSKEETHKALVQPYQVLFGHAGVTKQNYQPKPYSKLKDFNSTLEE